MIEVTRRYTVDLIPQRQDYALPGSYPREVVDLEYYEPDDRLETVCPKCRNEFSVKAGLWQRLMRCQGFCYCYRCHKRLEQFHMVKTLAYIAGQQPFLDEEVIA